MICLLAFAGGMFTGVGLIVLLVRLFADTLNHSMHTGS